ncbi:MAG TPA: oligosaccharide flippase family protein [bacterium]|nr:oligosaccharide flippase family protein [bacterium]
MLKELNVKLDVIYSFITIIILQIVLKIFTIGSKLILARLIIPEDFGLFAITLFIYTVFLYINDLGISVSTIRDEEIHYGNILLIQFIFSIILFIISILIKNYFIFLNPRIPEILPLFMVNLILTALAVPPTIYFTKEIKFKKNFLPRLIQIISEIIVSIWLAYRGYKVYSLIYAKIISNLLYLIYIWFLTIKDIKLNLKLSEIKPLIFRSKYFFLLGLFSIFSTDISKAILSYRFSDEIVGMFFMVWNFIFLPANIIEEPFRKICYPYLAKYKNNFDKLTKFYMNITKITLAIEIPIYIFLFLNIEFFISLIFPATKWNYSILIPLFKISLFVTIFDPFSMYGFELLKIFNKEKIILLVSILVTLFLCTIGTLFIFIFEKLNFHGVLGLAFSHYLLIFVSFITFYHIIKIIKKNFWFLAKDLLFIYLISFSLFFIINFFVPKKFNLTLLLLIFIIYFIYWKLYFKELTLKIYILIKEKILKVKKNVE